jgi:O-antigen/teichoic acid export membrane protein
VVLLAGGTAVGQGIVLLCTPVLSRLYSPSDFGILALFASWIFGILASVSSFSYKLAVPLPESDEDAANTAALGVAIVVVLSLVVGLAIGAVGMFNTAPSSLRPLTHYAWLAGLGSLVVGLYEVLTYWAIRQNDVPALARTRIGQGIAQAGGQIGLGLMHVGAVGLVGGFVAGQGVGLRYLGRQAWRKSAVAIRQVSVVGMRRMGRRYRQFAFVSTTASLINSITLYAPVIIIVVAVGERAGGWFALANRLMNAPTALVGQAVGKVYFGEAAALARVDRMLLRQRFLRLVFTLGIAGVLLSTVLVVTTPFWFARVFGARWEEAGLYVQLLGPVLLTDFVCVPVSQTLYVLERQNLQLTADIIEFSAVAALFAGVLVLGLSARWLVAAYALGNAVGGAVLVGFSWHAVSGLRDE